MSQPDSNPQNHSFLDILNRFSLNYHRFRDDSMILDINFFFNWTISVMVWSIFFPKKNIVLAQVQVPSSSAFWNGTSFFSSVRDPNPFFLYLVFFISHS